MCNCDSVICVRLVPDGPFDIAPARPISKSVNVFYPVTTHHGLQVRSGKEVDGQQ